MSVFCILRNSPKQTSPAEDSAVEEHLYDWYIKEREKGPVWREALKGASWEICDELGIAPKIDVAFINHFMRRYGLNKEDITANQDGDTVQRRVRCTVEKSKQAAFAEPDREFRGHPDTRNVRERGREL